ncbi:hypothetical protein [Streptosporangium sp. NPDC002721]|uniref:hypothetical protein n=1 Tax=Streptosporangium sp. NPDC002721 TaxID=3366188 RepID=UPI0036BBC55B
MSGTNGSVAGGSTPDVEFEVLCDVNAGVSTPFLRHYTTDTAGVVVTDDSQLDGVTAYTVTGTVGVCAAAATANPQIDSTAQRQTGAGTVTITTGARSVTLMVFAGAPTVSIGGGAAVAFPAGSSATWSVDQGGEALVDSFVFTGFAGADFAVLSTREV